MWPFISYPEIWLKQSFKVIGSVFNLLIRSSVAGCFWCAILLEKDIEISEYRQDEFMYDIQAMSWVQVTLCLFPLVEIDLVCRYEHT